jgi:hypothetical protein
MNAYAELRERHQKEINDFPMFFAFSNEQFAGGMARFGLTAEDTDKIYHLGGTGGYYLRSDSDRFHDMLHRQEVESQAAIAADTTGNGFIFDMFFFELANHEYGYTLDTSDTLEALNYTFKDIQSNQALLHGFRKACDKIRKEDVHN